MWQKVYRFIVFQRQSQGGKTPPTFILLLFWLSFSPFVLLLTNQHTFYLYCTVTVDRIILCLSVFVSLPPVVYEHRSRLEKSLQKERLEHKKAKEGEINCSGITNVTLAVLPWHNCWNIKNIAFISQQNQPITTICTFCLSFSSFILDYLVYKLESQQSLNKEKVFKSIPVFSPATIC